MNAALVDSKFVRKVEGVWRGKAHISLNSGKYGTYYVPEHIKGLMAETHVTLQTANLLFFQLLFTQIKNI
jgi:hypothetical protein